ncbi:MAG: hypothetical protein ACRES1_09105, partial [Steroidobacteraceae bacterium]
MNRLALNRLNLWQKLGALVLAMVLPAILVGFFYFTAMGGELSQARSELDGIRFVQGINSVESSMKTHGARAFVFASGDTARRAGVVSMQREVDTAMSHLDDIAARLGETYGVAADIATLRSQWSAEEAAALTQPAARIADAHAALIDRLDQLTAA